jgi:acylphosphatase
MLTTKRWRIHGRVQGVWYRQSTSEKAREYKLGGWVRNCADGSVELQVCGADSDIVMMEQWCRRGPTLAHVTQIEELAPEANCIPGMFEILK